jgi:peptidyl-tRNA hydrolase, PTH1 family
VSRLILGLGNPGEEYRATRHNVGFRVIEELARRFRVRLDRPECNALTALFEAPELALPAAADAVAPAPADGQVLLAQPQTYMNRSGYAARCLVERHAIAPGAVLAVYDEVALPLGRLRLRRAGGPAGHRGIESILENLRTDQVARLRIGIADPAAPVAAADLVDFVLAPFTAAEEEALAPVIPRAAEACEVWLREGIDAAMSRFNGG